MIGLNESLWILLLLVNFFTIIGIFKFFGRTGLFVWIGVTTILANIQVLKIIEIFGFVTALGNIIYSSTFLVTDILNELYGKKEAKKAVYIGFFTLIATTIIMTLCIYFIPHSSDIGHQSIKNIFSLMPRIALASLTAYFVSNNLDIWLFDLIKKRTKGRYLWIRNNTSTLTSQLIDNAIFTLIAFTGVLPFKIILEIFLTSYFLKFIITACDTPFLYLAKLLYKNEKIPV